jgi:hypothetical protein
VPWSWRAGGPFGPRYAHRGTAALRAFFTWCFSAGGGIGLQPCAVTDLPRSASRTATAGCSRRSPPAFPAGDPGPELVIAGPAVLRRRGTQMQVTFDSAADLAEARRRAAAAHGQHEERTGRPDPDWPDWYAEYMVREQAGEELPS